MLNLNYNINDALGGGGCIGVMKYNYSASIVVAGGGGGGSTGVSGGVGAGGGGGMAVTQSISIIPNVTYQVNVGGGGAIATDGQDSSFIGFDDNDTIPIAFYAGGGKGSTTLNGGNSGTGSLVRAGVTTTYTAFTGGTGAFQSSAFGPRYAGGGGASNQANGVNGSATDAGAFGGNGASGVTSGGGGGYLGAGPVPPPAGSDGLPGLASSGWGVGGNGSSAAPAGGSGRQASAGTNGTVIIRYAGQPKALVTNATTVTADGFTTHTFASGSGTFLYTYPYPWSDVVPYQVEECPQQKGGAVYSVRNDPFSASIVAAIPGTLFFTGDYKNQFGMTSAFDDISAYIRGNGSPIGTNLTTQILSTGSFIASASSEAIKWADQHYNTSLYFEGTSSLAVTNTWAAKQGANLTFEKDFVIETWVQWPVTASVSASTWTPNRGFAYKYDPSVLATSAYKFEPWGGTGGTGIISGSSRFVYDVAPATEVLVTGSINYLIEPNQFYHYAVSYTSQSFVDAQNDKNIRLYINGQLVGRYKVNTGDINQDTTELLQMFGVVDNLVPAQQDFQSGTPGWFTDFRLYNGTNKNYTGSIIPLPESMVTWG